MEEYHWFLGFSKKVEGFWQAKKRCSIDFIYLLFNFFWKDYDEGFGDLYIMIFKHDFLNFVDTRFFKSNHINSFILFFLSFFLFLEAIGIINNGNGLSLIFIHSF